MFVVDCVNLVVVAFSVVMRSPMKVLLLLLFIVLLVLYVLGIAFIVRDNGNDKWDYD